MRVFALKQGRNHSEYLKELKGQAEDILAVYIQALIVAESKYHLIQTILSNSESYQSWRQLRLRNYKRICLPTSRRRLKNFPSISYRLRRY